MPSASITPYGRLVSVSAHNCYVSQKQGYGTVCSGKAPGNSPEANARLTLDCLHSALDEGADLLELDLISANGKLRVAHEHHADEQNDALFSRVLEDERLCRADAGLFLEIKEKSNDATAAQIDSFLQLILDVALEFREYVRAGRRLYLRSFDVPYLQRAKELLQTNQYRQLRDHISLNVLFWSANESLQKRFSKIRRYQRLGIDGIELKYTSTNLLQQLNFAQGLDLKVGVYTIPKRLGEVYVATLRENVDFITTDYSILKCRQVVSEKNGLVYAPIWNEQAGSNQVKFFRRSNNQVSSVDLTAERRPRLQKNSSTNQADGTYLEFRSNRSEFLPLEDADNDRESGFLVSAAVRFDGDAVANLRTTMAIVNKSDEAAFALELSREPNGVVLRFGVHIKGRYRYARFPIEDLPFGEAHLITGAYDGSGGVWLFINNRDKNRSKNYSEAVSTNNSSITVGADPQGPANVRFFFTGQIQHVMVLNWKNH